MFYRLVYFIYSFLHVLNNTEEFNSNIVIFDVDRDFARREMHVD